MLGGNELSAYVARYQRDTAGAVEAVAYQAGDTIRAAGGRDGRYLGVELKASW